VKISISTLASISRRLSNRDERLAAAENARVVAVIGEQRQRLLDRIGPRVIKRSRFSFSWLHCLPPAKIGVDAPRRCRQRHVRDAERVGDALAMQAGVLMQLPRQGPWRRAQVNGDGEE